MGIKENWFKEDKTCLTCGNVTERQRGITRQNVRRLFSFNWTATEWTITLLILGYIMVAFFLRHDLNASRQFSDDLHKYPNKYCSLLEDCSVNPKNVLCNLSSNSNLNNNIGIKNLKYPNNCTGDICKIK